MYRVYEYISGTSGNENNEVAMQNFPPRKLDPWVKFTSSHKVSFFKGPKNSRVCSFRSRFSVQFVFLRVVIFGGYFYRWQNYRCNFLETFLERLVAEKWTSEKTGFETSCMKFHRSQITSLLLEDLVFHNAPILFDLPMYPLTHVEYFFSKHVK